MCVREWLESRVRVKERSAARVARARVRSASESMGMPWMMVPEGNSTMSESEGWSSESTR